MPDEAILNSPEKPSPSKAHKSGISQGEHRTGKPASGLTPQQKDAIRKAFEDLHLVDHRPPPPPTLKLSLPIVSTEDSEREDEVKESLTDTEPSSPLPSTRTSSFGSMATTSMSSMGSSNSLWSAISTSTSVSSIGEGRSSDSVRAGSASPPKVHNVTAQHDVPKADYCGQLTASPGLQPPKPAVVDDIFNSTSSAIPKQQQFLVPKSPSPSSAAGKLPARTLATPRRFIRSNTMPELGKPVNPPAPLTTSLSLNSMSQFDIGTDHLEPFIIAHHNKVQQVMDGKRIAWGVQYELARGVTLGAWDWEQIRQKVNELRGTNAEAAYRVRSVMFGKSSVTNNHLSIWKELDREDAAILENKSRGLGLQGAWMEEPNWYGGRVQQLARLVKEEGKYEIQLEPLEKRRSHRFARYCGSRRIIQLRVADALVTNENAAIKDFLKRKFILCGRVFVPFHAKDNSLYMVETNEDWQRRPQTWCGDEFRRSFSEFVNWHNPLSYNFKQPISKWVTRFALGLSNSIPVLEFKEEKMFFIDDIYAPDWTGGKAPAEKIMTDGAGFINRAALTSITRHMGLQYLPAALQGRIAGAKGMFMLHPSDDEAEPCIWIRDSQNKINLPHLRDKSHRIFDLLSISRSSSTVSLSQQSILNLSFNGVPDEVLISLMEQGLVDDIAPLLDWDRSNAMVFLWDALNKSGNVSGSRAQRFASGVSRVLGLQRREWGHQDVRMEKASAEYVDEPPVATNTGRNEHSGAPLSLSESALELVQAGFHPAESKLLRDRIQYVVGAVVQTALDKYRIPLQTSIDAFILPDPLGVLEEGQIYYRSSQPRKDPETEMLYQVLEGEVVLGRYPIRLPSDMQKVVAVNIPELYNWSDVIIASTKGSRSLASLLNGGDMDGDEVFIVVENRIVAPFCNQPFSFPPDNLIEQDFERDVETVTAFCQRATSVAVPGQQKAFLDVLLLSLTDSKVGLYSGIHENAVKMYGYQDPKTIRVAYIFATLLDSSKTGLRLKAEIFEKDQKEFASSKVKRSPENPFILDKLLDAGRKKADELLSRYKSADSSITPRRDKHLEKPYEVAQAHALKAYQNGFKTFTNELSKIRDYVDEVYEKWLIVCRQEKVRKEANAAQASPKKKQQYQVKTTRDDPMLAVTEMFAKPISDIFLLPNVEELKASYAYCSHPNSPFPFNVAFRELCVMKARSSNGGIAPSIRIFDEVKAISASRLVALNKAEEDAF
ncbi:RNA dependent RNA polymerase-domain-containing protein [Crucibulum laeve]|uniref:RNA-dependent RNA polymerase n=1 Tax=Crucibulum laeve TaxID=68775 RepID=A0A5C3MA53_9AGAR|nr:RNA dependent RNA polymerase-domain-containing protein [Crucibulum laeve]